MAGSPLFFPNPHIGYSSLLAEECHMTYHAILFTKDLMGFVWITEHYAALGRGHDNLATIEKVTHLKEQNVAFSGWGDIVMMEAQTHFANAIRGGTLSLSDDNSENVRASLCDFARHTVSLWMDQVHPMEPTDRRGIIVATFGKKPRVYRLGLVRAPTCYEIHDQLNAATAGDSSSPANLFVRYYYPRSNKSIRELLGIGIHTVRLARSLNTAAVGEPDAWVCNEGGFRQLTIDEIAEYIRFSESLDTSILNQFSNCPNVVG
jgi:hypothetical protein